MILFFNVFVTTKAFTIYDRGELGPSQDRFDVFKYTLASFQPLKWEHVVIYAELDEMYAERKAELEGYIYSLFPNAIFYPYRNKHQRDWKVAMEKLFALPSDQLVWFSCNDDHIFIDYETELFERLHNAALAELMTHPHVAIFPFAWAERICYSEPSYVGHEEPNPYPILRRTPDYFMISWGHNDSAQVVSTEVLRKWWFDFDYGDAFKPRTDTGPSPEPGVTDIHTIMPWRELSLHYDGSSNVGIDPNAYPAHQIPEGFFESNIKIQFGGTKRLEGYVWMNPDIEKRSSVTADGVDYRGVIEDVPLFWRGRIGEIKIADEQPEEFWVRRRNDAILHTASQFWSGTQAELLEALSPVFRKLNGQILLSDSAERLNRYSHATCYKADNQRSDFSFIVLERYAQQTGFQTVHSLSDGLEERSRSQIIWVGTEPKIDRAMFSRVEKHLVLNDYDARQLSTYHKHAAWNLGAERANAAFLVFTDSLNIFPANFIRIVEPLMANCDALLVGSRYLTFGPYSESGSAEPVALVVKRSKFHAFSEDPMHLGEYGGLDRCAEQLRQQGLLVANAPSSLFCWRVPCPRINLLETARPPISVGDTEVSRRGLSKYYLDPVSRALLQNDPQRIGTLLRMIPQYPGVGQVAEIAANVDNPTRVLEGAMQLVSEFNDSAEHLGFAASVSFIVNDLQRAFALSANALRLDPLLLSPRLIQLTGLLSSNPEAARAECFHLIRMYPLEESLWSMIGL